MFDKFCLLQFTDEEATYWLLYRSTLALTLTVPVTAIDALRHFGTG